MSSPARNEMDVDAFLAWAEGRRRPLGAARRPAGHDGAGAGGARADQIRGAKGAGRRNYARRAAVPHVSQWDDGPNHRRTAFEPDALVVCPPPTDLNTMEIPNPVIVVEVLSPSTAADDHGVKLDGYFSLPSVAHYLILDADRRVMIWHRRGSAGAIETRVVRDGVIRLDPPGFEAEAAAFFAIE